MDRKVQIWHIFSLVSTYQYSIEAFLKTGSQMSGIQSGVGYTDCSLGLGGQKYVTSALPGNHVLFSCEITPLLLFWVIKEEVLWFIGTM